ncbi:ferredoxin-NADP reductase [Neisseria animaloris]|uniref:Ferredoxin--NADP reductase n=1 Tax=Neisseria animaloris TaxID=326522 RepID=A0A1X3CJ29_9NEIS|nr:ferredoxin--NADP reductase [Neisseria animaloris]MDO5073230.1 ferredoxin--NADP reductase [Neisseria animaloris]OSI07680.1 ferredoxin--NADP(+) reductase [Neisseria animaloris]VEH88309.1 ferredoxin-NADP reductase [Neisseria animaloris]VEJ21654.1 ferredoxin-NADP reductase [Neisseria animaloris]
MAAFNTQTVLSVHHWTDAYFTFTCTRDESLRFENGQFVMVGLMVDGKPLMRAYSVASANWEEHLEFFSIKVQDGPLTSRLQHLKVGDEVLISKKPTGTLICGDLNPGKNLYLLSTGTGIAPFLSITKDPEVYEQFEKVILVHGVRYKKDLAYYDRFTKELPEHEYLGEVVKEKLIYYPVVSREEYPHQGHITDLMRSGKMFKDIGLPMMNPEHDRAMLCGSPAMLKDVSAVLNEFGLVVSPKMGQRGDYLIERAFVDQ